MLSVFKFYIECDVRYFQRACRLWGRNSNYYKETFNLFFVLTLAFRVRLFHGCSFCARFIQVIFGLEWEESGYITQSLAFLVIVRFVSSPLAMFGYRERQKEDLIWQVGLMLITFSPQFSTIDAVVPRGVLLHSLAVGVWYLLCLLISSRLAH